MKLARRNQLLTSILGFSYFLAAPLAFPQEEAEDGASSKMVKAIDRQIAIEPVTKKPKVIVLTDELLSSGSQAIRSAGRNEADKSPDSEQ